ncbi:MAG: hypothetical protein M3433_06795 [Actinomycetota bacterium]|nr:hypothetical protein [Actinomycetota bacterium]
MSTAASAQSPDRPDPDSPAGVEYELPLDRARERAAGDAPRQPGSRGENRGPAGSAPLFGVGIGPSGDGGSVGDGGDPSGGAGGDPGSGGGSSSSAGSGGADGSGGGGGSGSQDGAGSDAGGAPGVSAAAQANAGGSDLGPTAAIVAGVLIAAGALGLFMRRTMGAR